MPKQIITPERTNPERERIQRQQRLRDELRGACLARVSRSERDG